MNEDTRKVLAKLMAKTEIGMDNYPLNCVNELLRLSKTVRKNLKKIHTPIILIHSKFDNLSSTKSAKIVYNKISSEIKEYIELEKSYHMVLYDNEKEFVMNKVLEFISNRLTSKEENKEVFESALNDLKEGLLPLGGSSHRGMGMFKVVN